MKLINQINVEDSLYSVSVPIVECEFSPFAEAEGLEFPTFFQNALTEQPFEMPVDEDGVYIFKSDNPESPNSMRIVITSMTMGGMSVKVLFIQHFMFAMMMDGMIDMPVILMKQDDGTYIAQMML